MLQIKMDTGLSAHIVIWYFDDMDGQKRITTTPKIEGILGSQIFKTLSRLVDIHFDTGDCQFNYSDHLFTSLNMKFSMPSATSRGGVIDFVISLIVTPPSDQVLIRTLDMWEYIPAIKEICNPFLLYFTPEEGFIFMDEIEEELNGIIIEIIQIISD